jgi:RNA polymerase sigma factor (sigma-70 family)
MAGRTTVTVLEYIRGLVGAGTASDVSDQELLARFVTQRDQGAFEVLVRRYGPLVLGVCRRRLWDPQDVEDAYQATFLVLVRKAGSLRRRELLRNWLYGVANRIAVRARAYAARRRDRQRHVDDVAATETPCAATQREVRAVLDDEVLRLPEKYRAPVLLCYFEDKTNQEAAGLLGWPLGTVATRLARAREILGLRLVKRGLALSVGALSAALAQEAVAAVPPALTVAALKTGALAAAGVVVPDGMSTQALALAQSAGGELFRGRLKLVIVLLLAVTMAGASVGALGRFSRATDRERSRARDPQTHQVDNQPGQKFVWRERGTLNVLRARGSVHALAFTADGKTLASAGMLNQPQPQAEGPSTLDSAVKLWNVATGELRGTLGAGAVSPDLRQAGGGGGTNRRALAFSPDGQTLATAATALSLWDVAHGKVCATIHEEVHCLRYSADGTMLCGLASDGAMKEWDAATTTLRATHRLDLGEPWKMALAPGGKVLALLNPGDPSPKLWDAASGKARTFAPRKDTDASITAIAFAPDGKTLASGHVDGTVSLWDVVTREELVTLDGHEAQITALAFTADGRTLASGDQNGVVKFWAAEKER